MVKGRKSNKHVIFEDARIEKIEEEEKKKAITVNET
jgi:hypothetical protein